MRLVPDRPDRSDDEPRTVVKLSGAADVIGVIPHRLGFHPTESLVVVCLEGPRRRDRLVMRFDLVAARWDADVRDDVVRRFERTGAEGVFLLCYTEVDAADGDLPRGPLMRGIVDALLDRRVDVYEAVLVHRGRFWSYHCTEPSCCPPDGEELPAEPTPAATRYAAELVLQGAAVLPTRRTLEACIEPSDHAVAVAVREQAVARADLRLMDVIGQLGVDGLRDVTLATFNGLVDSWERGERDLDVDDVALVAVGMHDKLARDEAMTMVLDHDPSVLVSLLTELARMTGDLDAAPVCTVLAWAAYAEGGGALASVAVERALRCDPTYAMARLVRNGLDGMMSPRHVTEISRAVRADLARGVDAEGGDAFGEAS